MRYGSAIWTAGSGERGCLSTLCHPDMLAMDVSLDHIVFKHLTRYVCVCLTIYKLLLCDRERREITGDKLPLLSGFCGSNVNGTFYVFAGCDHIGYTNEVPQSILMHNQTDL